MMNKKNNIWLNAAIIGAVWILGMLLAPGLPEQMPVHFDIHGQPDGYANKYFVLSLLPAVALLALAITRLAVKFSKRGFGGRNQRYMAMFELVFTLFLVVIHISMVIEAKYPHADIFARTIIPALSLLLILLGNSLGKLERNGLVGVKLPWTLRSDENWLMTHRFSGKAFVVGGALCLMLSLFGFPVTWSVVILLLMVFLPIVYSYLHYAKHEKIKS
jgi:uncharacterized membrane protein